MTDPRLRPSGNLLLAGVATIVAVALTALSPEHTAVTLIGLAFGWLSGVLQSRAVREFPERFTSTRTASEFRDALTSTRDGKRAFQLQWICIAVMAFVAWRINSESIGMGFTAGLCALGAASDLTARPAVRDLWPSD